MPRAPLAFRRAWLPRALALLLLCGALVAIYLVTPPRAVRHGSSSPPAYAEPFVYLADDGTSTDFLLADASHLTSRRVIKTVAHARGWSGASSVSPDSKTLAYTVLPAGQANPDQGAELWVLSLPEGHASLLAAGVDLRSSLTWSPDSASVLYQRQAGASFEIWRQPIGGGAPELLAAPPPGAALLPVGYDGSSATLLVAVFGSRGTDLEQIGRSGPPHFLHHLSDGPVRGFQLSPDGDRAAYLFADSRLNPPRSRAAVFSISAGTLQLLPQEWGEIIGVTWEPRGTLVVGTTGPLAGLRDEGGAWVRSREGSGFEQPLAWSASGRFLASRHFTGASGSEPGAAGDVLLQPEGGIHPLPAGPAERFVGWLTPHAGTGGQ